MTNVFKRWRVLKLTLVHGIVKQALAKSSRTRPDSWRSLPLGRVSRLLIQGDEIVCRLACRLTALTFAVKAHKIKNGLETLNLKALLVGNYVSFARSRPCSCSKGAILGAVIAERCFFRTETPAAHLLSRKILNYRPLWVIRLCFEHSRHDPALSLPASQHASR